jgi:hypothetical protein
VDYNIGITIRDCWALGASNFINGSTTGAGAGRPGGIIIHGCTYHGANSLVALTTNYSSGIPSYVYNSYVFTAGTAISAALQGQLIEDNNLLWASTPRALTTAGTESVVAPAYANLVHIGQNLLMGGLSYPLGTPLHDSPLAGFGTTYPNYYTTTDINGRPRVITYGISDAGTATSGTTTTLTDITKSWVVNGFVNYTIAVTGGTASGSSHSISSNTADTITFRGAGTSPDSTSTYIIFPSNSVGCFSKAQIPVKETTVTSSGSTSIKLIGVGEVEFDIPVNAESTVISIMARYDSTHGTINKPQFALKENTAIGVSAQTVTMSVGIDTWETLSLSSITPTSKGVVTVRLINRSQYNGGIVYFDSANVPEINTGDFEYFKYIDPVKTLVNQGQVVEGSTGIRTIFGSGIIL